MKPTILLFDVDGTLVTTGGAGGRAIGRAFHELFGRAEACRSFRFDGMTDRAIVRLGLEAIGRVAETSAIDAVLERYVTVLADEIAQIEPARYREHEGMRTAVEAARVRGLAVGLGTGNVHAGAKLKLDRVGLSEHFGFGGYGDDHEDRPALIRIGAERGAATLGVPLDEVRVVIIGDTPKDVAAAQAMGAESLAVATGHFDVAALRACGATRVYGTLAEPGALAWLLGD